MFSRILIATDGSDVSLRAAKVAIDLARRLSIGVYAFHVAAPYEDAIFVTDIYVDQDFYSSQTVAYATRSLSDIAQLAEEAGVPCASSYRLEKRTHSAILATAEAERCDLIVMGSHGKRGLDRLLLGSETQKVMLNTELPVMVCR
jgi:nucleotide-binding universal stress UspA family protein